jgi:hypothetical protein
MKRIDTNFPLYKELEEDGLKGDMNKAIAVITVVIIGILGAVYAYSGSKESSSTGSTLTVSPTLSSFNVEEVDQSNMLQIRTEIESAASGDLSQQEINGLVLMREEEKLARDVYTTLYEIWGQRIFTNIARSEQTHTDSVKQLLDKYKIADPVTNDTVGVFTNPDLQDLYDSLVDRGRTSLLDALIVGATVEDLDIYDLNKLSAQTDNEDILLVYANLTKGSRNHLRSFTSLIERNGGAYKAQYLTVTEVDDILNTSRETGIVQ